MRAYGFLFIFLLSLNCPAALAPRMYSIFLQGAVTTSKSETSAQKTIYTHKADINLMYSHRYGPTFGIHFVNESVNERGYRESGYSYGGTLGYYWERGWFVLAHYESSAELDTWIEGSGQQFDFGYLEHIGSQYHIGLQISDRSVSYKNQYTPSQGRTRTVQDNYPSFVLMYLF